MDFEELLDRRKSIRRFLDKQVSDEMVNKIISAAVKAPTNCNTQLWNFIIIRDINVKERLIKEAASNTLIGRAPVLIVPTHDNAIAHEGLQSVMMAIQNMLLEASNIGLGAVCINSIGSPSKIRKVLKIPKTELICSFVLIGYAAEDDKKAPPIPRRQLEEVIHREGFENKRKKIFTHDPEDWTIENISDYQRYFCRKTFLGKEMDLAGKEERELVNKILSREKGPFLDLLSYDGSYINNFPENEQITTSDLNDQTALYTMQSAQGRKIRQTEHRKLAQKKERFRTITLIYKAERLPKSELRNAIKTAKDHLDEGGKIIIISRRKYSAYGIIYMIIRTFFSNDIRKTGIFAFFGPYKPIVSGEIKKILIKEGLKTREEQYFLIPPISDMAYQMYKQFKASEGTSFLHRIRREDILSKLIRKLIDLQGISRSPMGSVTVITAQK
ncbi:nitroreductase [Candidatus Woesearchaeota archaeon]|nr:nitroreductase [Candidatus Woesearchaeota archaeon]